MIKRYDKFIERCKNRILNENEYIEVHHILPRCQGGLDEEDNLIKLTAREHYIAHKMLYRENKDVNKLAQAFHCMCYLRNAEGRRYKITSRDFELAKKACSEAKKGMNPFRYKTEEEMAQYGQNVRNRWFSKSENERAEINLRRSQTCKESMSNRTKEEQAEINEKKMITRHQSKEHEEKLSREQSVRTKKQFENYTKEQYDNHMRNQGSAHTKHPYKCVETGDIITNKYELRDLLGKEVGQSCMSNLSSCAQGLKKQAYGYHWVYA